MHKIKRNARKALQACAGRPWHDISKDGEVHIGYLYLQKYMPNNTFDTRVTIIGDRAFAFTRKNRENDFRASGSGRIDWSPEKVETRMIHEAFKNAKHLGAQTIAFDFLTEGESLAIIELTLSYASWAIDECPGHWRLNPNNSNGLEWVEGQTRAADAIFADFVADLAS